MKTLPFLLEKEFKQMARHLFLPKMFIIFPVIMTLLLPWAADPSIDNIPLALVDRDASPRSLRLARALTATGDFRLATRPPSFPLALEDISAGRAEIILEIPPRFSADLQREGRATLLIAANGVNGTRGGLAAAALATLVGETAGGNPLPLQLHTLQRFNPTADYKPFMIPALLVMLMTLLCGFLPALNIVGEKESGTIEQINVTPVGKFTFIAAKLIPYWLLGAVILAYGILLANLFYGLTPAGSIGTIYLFALLFVPGIAGMGLIVSNHSATMQQAMFVMFFFLILFLLMSGFFSPVESMPAWARAIAACNPLKYFVQAIRAVYLKGSAAADLREQLLALAAFALLTNAWAVWSFRKSS
ncbi:MAG: ABC transporter permease [Odoribacteraceae bacterium]|nr:ABC transporter permease [Odoribacteraceae bacterium]